jgi:predicted transcriptional regulator
MKQLNKIIRERVLQETLRLIREHKVISIEKLAQLKNNSRDVLLIEVGALEILGCIMIKYGLNIKIVAITEKDCNLRFKERFENGK